VAVKVLLMLKHQLFLIGASMPVMRWKDDDYDVRDGAPNAGSGDVGVQGVDGAEWVRVKRKGPPGRRPHLRPRTFWLPRRRRPLPILSWPGSPSPTKTKSAFVQDSCHTRCLMGVRRPVRNMVP
jgi:hypothetical protein